MNMFHNRYFLIYFYFLLLPILSIFLKCRDNDTHELKPDLKNELERQVKIESSEKLILALADSIIDAISRNDWDFLTYHIHPDRGIRFSPYAFIDTTRDLTFSRNEIRHLISNKNQYKWGFYDGSGESIKLNFGGYYKRFIYDKDYKSAKRGALDDSMISSNTVNNIIECYKNLPVHFVEYYNPGSNEYDGMDWSCLRLVFEYKNKRWYLIGIVHDQWTT